MKKIILIPTDFSKNAWDAIAYTLELFKNSICDFYFLNVYNFPGFLTNSAFVTMPSNEIYDEFKTLSINKLKETIEAVSFRFKNPKHKYHYISEHNSLFYAAENFVNKNKVDLLIMGTKGATNDSSLFFGSNAVSIMENINQCPVLIIPEMAKYHPPKEIVFSTDFKPIDHLNKLNTIIEIAKLNQSKICVLHINKEATLSNEQLNNKTRLETFLNQVTSEMHYLNNGSLFGALSCFIQSRNSDMLVFFAKKQGILQKVFSESLVKHMGHHSKIPVLLLH